jgi:hypothetical protein
LLPTLKDLLCKAPWNAALRMMPRLNDVRATAVLVLPVLPVLLLSAPLAEATVVVLGLVAVAMAAMVAPSPAAWVTTWHQLERRRRQHHHHLHRHRQAERASTRDPRTLTRSLRVLVGRRAMRGSQQDRRLTRSLPPLRA